MLNFHRKTVLLAVLTLISAQISCVRAMSVVSFLDVGQGDCTIIQSAGHNMVIDTGPPGSWGSLDAQLNEHGIKRIDVLILSHPHEDHDANLGYLVEDIPIETLIMPQYADDEEDYGSLIRCAVGQGTRIVYPAVGDQFVVGDASVMVLSAADPAKYPDDKNLWSIVLKIEDNETSIIVCGDAEDINEYATIDAGLDLSADILRVGHHGSSTSTSGAFLDAVKPDVAIISCGADNPYGHPHAETLEALYDRQIVVLRTDLNGTITATIDAEAYKITKEK